MSSNNNYSYVERSEMEIEVSASNHDATYMELVTSYLPTPPTDTRHDEVCDGGTASTLIIFMH